MQRWAVLGLLVATALAGCGDDKPAAPANYTCPNGQVVPIPSNHTGDPATLCAQTERKYEIIVQVREETDTGRELPNSEVYIVPVADYDETDPTTVGTGRYTDTSGRLAAEFREPTEVYIQVLGPEAVNWAREGLRLMVGETITQVPTEPSVTYTITDRTVTVPMFYNDITVEANGTWGGPTAARPGTDGSVEPAVTFLELSLDKPADVASATWARAARATATLTWLNLAADDTTYGDMYCAIAYGTTIIATGEDTSNTGNGQQQETCTAELAPADRQTPDQPVSIAVLTDSMVLGEDPGFSVKVRLYLEGRAPTELAIPPGCLPPDFECAGPTLPVVSKTGFGA